jgi:hypothetical protein
MLDNKYSRQCDIHPSLDDIYPQVLKWVNEVLVQKNLSPVDQLHSVHDMAWSMVAKVIHEKGTWYFKALTPHIEYELDITAKLSDMFPGRSTSLVALDRDQRFMIVEDLGENLFEYQPQSDCFSLWKKTLTDYAELQNEISKIGFEEFHFLPDRRLESVPKEALSIIEQCIHIEPRSGEKAVNKEDVDWIREYFKHWSTVIEEIYELPIPSSLHHGDLHGGNIAMRNKPTVFDWGDSSWSHPFVTFFISADACTNHLALKDENSYVELQEAYLRPWREYGSIEQLRLILERVNRISPLIMLLSWAYAISNKADPRANEWENGLCTWVNEFLRLNRDS